MTTSTEPGQEQVSRRRRIAYVALTVVWYGAGVLGLAELFLQLRWIPPSALSYGSFGAHPVYATGPLPGAKGRHVNAEYDVGFEINRLGFRGPLPELDLPATKPRLLVVGDSQTFGLGVDNGETFCDRLRERLPEVDVLNAGSNGYGTREQLAVIDHLGEAWRPDVVLLVFFWNDIEDNVKRSTPAFGVYEQGRVSRTDPHDEAFDALALRPPVEVVPRGVSGLRLPKYLKEGLRGLRYRTLGIKRRKIRTEAQKTAAFEVTRELLRLTKLRCDELGSRLVIASLPSQTQVDPSAVIRNIEPLNYEVQEQLFAICADLGVQTVDLQPPLEAEFRRTGEPLYYFVDRHLMASGHAIIGDVLVEALGPYLQDSPQSE